MYITVNVIIFNSKDLQVQTFSDRLKYHSLDTYTYCRSSFELVTILHIQLMIFPGIRAIIYIYIYIIIQNDSNYDSHCTCVNNNNSDNVINATSTTTSYIITQSYEIVNDSTHVTSSTLVVLHINTSTTTNEIIM